MGQLGGKSNVVFKKGQKINGTKAKTIIWEVWYVEIKLMGRGNLKFGV